MANASKKSIAIITYSSVTRESGLYYVNRALGVLVDGLSRHFSNLLYLASDAPRKSPLYQNGKSIYNYVIKAKNVEMRILSSATKETYSAKFVNLMMNLRMLYSSIISSDIVYIFLPGYTGLVACFVSRLLKKPYILYFGAVWEDIAGFRISTDSKSFSLFPLYRGFYSKAGQFVVKKAKLIVVAGRYLHNSVSRFNSHTYETSPMVQFSANPFKEPAGGDISEKVRILFVGPIQLGKGVVYLIKAMPLIVAAGIEIDVFLVGSIDEEYKCELESTISRISLVSKVHFVGYVSDVQKLKDLYRVSDIFIIPTLGEGFPRVIYEAMLSGLPVIASNIDSIKQNIGEEDIATLVSPRNSREIADAVIELCTNKNLRRYRIRQGAKFAEKKLQGIPAMQLISLMKKHGLL